MAQSQIAFYLARISDTTLYECKFSKGNITILKKTQDALQRPVVIGINREGNYDNGMADPDFDKVRELIEAFYVFGQQVNDALKTLKSKTK